MTSRAHLLGLLFVLELLILSAIVFLALRYLMPGSSDWMVSVASVESLPLGIGGGGCFTSYYDREGIKVEYDPITNGLYTGPAPLFLIEPLPNTADPCGYPDVVTPTLATAGVPVYPLVLTAVIEDKRIKSGESTRLLATASLADRYPPTASMALFIPVPVTSTIPLSFTLGTTTFDYTPGQQRIDYVGLDFERPASYSWIISPKESAAGRQTLVVGLDSERFFIPLIFGLHLNVRHITGLDVALVGSVGAAGTFLAGLLGIARFFPDIWASYRDWFHRKKPAPRPLGFKTNSEK
jgi:hypothetical protein